MLTEKEKRELETAEKRGWPVKWSSGEEKFIFAISGIRSLEVDASIFASVAANVQSLIAETGFSCELSGVVLFPIILNSQFTRKDFVRKKRDNSIFIGTNISYELWMKATKKRRHALAIQFCKNAFESIPEKRLSAESKATLIEMFDYDLTTMAKQKSVPV